MIHPATLIKNSWRAYAKDYRAWLLLTSPLAALAAIFIALDWARTEGLFKLFGSTNTGVSALLAGIAILLFGLAATIFVGRVFSTAVAYASYRSLAGQKPEIKNSYRIGYMTFWPVLWVSTIQALIITGGLILFVVPGIICTLQYSLAVQVAIIENKRGMDALRRSKELTKGRLFEAAIDFGVIGLIIGYGAWLISIAVLLIFMILGSIISMATPSSTYGIINTTVGVIAIMTELIVVWLAIPLSPLACMALYKDFSNK